MKKDFKNQNQVEVILIRLQKTVKPLADSQKVCEMTKVRRKTLLGSKT